MRGPILIVEDDGDSRAMLTTLFEGAGFAVTTAVNGRAALMECRRQCPRVILLDLMMPVMNGEEFREHQLLDPMLAPIPIVIVSARHDARETARRLRAAGCHGKPVEFDALVTLVSELCPRIDNS